MLFSRKLARQIVEDNKAIKGFEQVVVRYDGKKRRNAC
jgi:hypothetical protein